MKTNHKVWKRGVILLIALALSVSLLGCSMNKKADVQLSPSVTSKVETTHSAETASKQTTYPLTVKDDTGTSLIFDKAPERITTLLPSETETVYAIGAGDKLFGVDNYSDYPAEAKSKPHIGDMNLNLEALLATKPDVVFASSSINKTAIDQIRAHNIKVFANDPKTVDKVMAKIETVGLILNLQENAKKVTDQMRKEKQIVVDAVKDAPKKKVYLEFSPGWTVGDGEFLNELLILAGGTNVAAGTKGWFAIDPEAIIKENPEVILYAKGESGMDSILDAIMKRSGWDQIDAIKNKKLFPLESNPLVRVGPRLTQGLIEIAKAIHPDLIK
ncbi:MAG: transporter substrate-binding protein [Bacilli bacterium]|nr:transporter substrate-binding protein [Bacilli bacterium]